jgi:hypothetical protein
MTYIVVSPSIGLSIENGRFSDGTNMTLDFLLLQWMWLTFDNLMLMTLVGLLVATAGYMVPQGYRLLEVSVVAPLNTPHCLYPCSGAISYGVIYPIMISVLGMAMIAGGGLFVFYRETMLGRSRAGWR